MVAALCLTLLMGFTGCQTSTGGGGGSLASVVIDGPHTPAQLQALAVQVFVDNGYYYESAMGGVLTFVRQGNRVDKALYGSYFDDGVHYKVRLSIEPMGSNQHKIHCSAVTIRNMGDEFFEEERKLRKPRMRQFQTMLNEIEKRIES